MTRPGVLEFEPVRVPRVPADDPVRLVEAVRDASPPARQASCAPNGCQTCSCRLAPGKVWRSPAEREAWQRRATKRPPVIAGTRFFHGGPDRLAPGDRILPPAVTDLPSTHERHGWRTVDRGVRTDVFVATTPWLALVFTRLYRPGRVYLVEPEGPLRPDLAHDGEAAWRCASATVLGESWPGMGPALWEAYNDFTLLAGNYMDARHMESPHEDDKAIIELLRDSAPCNGGAGREVGELAWGEVRLPTLLAQAIFEFAGGLVCLSCGQSECAGCV